MKEQDIDLDRMFYTKIMARAHVKRAAALVWASKLEESLLDFDTVLNNPAYCQILGDKDCATLHKDKARVQIRMRSNEIKAEGDKCFYHEDLESAYNKYKEAIEADQENEYALANISVIHLKRLEYAESIDFAGQALSIVNNFQSETKLFAGNNVLEVKLLLRRAKSFEMQSQWELAKQDLDKVLMLEPKNSEAASALKQVTSKLDQLMFGQY
jgi:tetratricopeptide (TPR) repeat protein